MSLVSKISPVGIDKAVDTVQSKLYSYLTTTASWTDYESYPRAYKNPKGSDIIPEIYVGDNEYIEALFDDKFTATSFFLVDDNVTNNNGAGDEAVYTQGVSIIFQVNLVELYPLIPHRADAEMHDDVFKAFNSFDLEVDGFSVGIDNVYSDVSLSGLLKSNIELTDLSDCHFVKFDVNINYLYNCKFNEL